MVGFYLLASFLIALILFLSRGKVIVYSLVGLFLILQSVFTFMSACIQESLNWFIFHTIR